MIKLNLGCGQKYLNGYINTDVVKSVKADKYFDLDKTPYPFKENSVDEILMDNVLEHVENVISVMEELYRILKPKGVIKIYVPYAKSDGALQDPTHKHFFTEKTMEYFSYKSDYNYYTNIRFELIQNKLFNNNRTLKSKIRMLIPLKRVLKFFIFNMYDGLYIEMKAIK